MSQTWVRSHFGPQDAKLFPRVQVNANLPRVVKQLILEPPAIQLGHSALPAPIVGQSLAAHFPDHPLLSEEPELEPEAAIQVVPQSPKLRRCERNGDKDWLAGWLPSARMQGAFGSP